MRIHVNRLNPLAPDICLFAQTKQGAFDMFTGKGPNSPAEYRDVDGMRPGTALGSHAYWTNLTFKPTDEVSITFYVRGTPDDLDYPLTFNGDVDFNLRKLSDSGGHRVLATWNPGGQSTFVDSTSSMWSGNPCWVTFVYNIEGSAVDHFMYINGELEDTVNQFITNGPGRIEDLNVGDNNTSGSAPCNNTTFNHVMMHARALNAHEVRALHRNPWQIYARSSFVIHKPYDWRDDIPAGVEDSGPIVISVPTGPLW